MAGMMGKANIIILMLEVANLLLLFWGVLGYEFRRDKKGTAAGIGIILFRAAVTVLLPEAFVFNRYVAVLIPAAAMSFFMKGRPAVSLMIGITMVQIISMMDTINIGIWTLVVRGDAMRINLVWTYYLGALGCLALMELLSVILRDKKQAVYENVQRISLWVFIPFLACLWILCYYSPAYGGDMIGYLPEIIQAKNQVRDGFIAFILIGFLIVTCALISKHREMKRLLILNQRCIEEQAEQYRRQGEEDTRLRSFRHDYNAHITVMQTLAKRSDLRQLRDYVCKLSEMAESKLLYNTNHLIGDAILNQYANICREKGITLKINGKFPDRIAISDTELCVILSNAMKNAYEAAIDCVDGDILLEIRSAGNFVNLKIVNSARRQPCFRDGRPVTTKRDEKNHGIGTRNMLETARRAGGEVTWEWNEKGYVITNILLKGSQN